jgi:hypothetical protein|uniref:Uncharacterized protein n=1 Tax=viral metagenome TaxID=1070528 RepID=A0A6C0IK03_9ZZZZ
MNYTFNLNTTACKPLSVTCNGNTTMKHLRELLFEEIKINTVFTEDDILDIFIPKTQSSETLSIPTTNDVVKDFIPMNRHFFPFSPDTKNTYTLYAIDRMYRERIDPPVDTAVQHSHNARREIKTNHSEGFIQSTKRMLSLW